MMSTVIWLQYDSSSSLFIQGEIDWAQGSFAAMPWLRPHSTEEQYINKPQQNETDKINLKKTHQTTQKLSIKNK